MRLLLSIVLLSGALQADLVRDAKKEVVFDSETFLTWQDTRDNVKVRRDWSGAYKYCIALELNNHKDWRLPTKDELLSIVDLTGKVKLNPIFEHKIASAYWTSSVPKNDLPLAWRVNFDDGKAHWGAQKFDFNIRCVRDTKHKISSN